MNKPIYEIGETLYYRKQDVLFKVASSDVVDDLVIYFDAAGNAYKEPDVVPYFDFMRLMIAKGIVRLNVGFDIEDNPQIISTDRDKTVIHAEIKTDKLFEYYDRLYTGKVIIEGFKMPSSCWDCPMAAVEYDDRTKDTTRLLCTLQSGSIDGVEMQSYKYVRRVDCPLRAVSMQSIIFEK